MEQMKERFWASGKTVSGECFELFPDVSYDGTMIMVDYNQNCYHVEK